MAMEMELTQISQLLAWLESERKKDKALLATLEERIQGVASGMEQQARRMQELDTSLAAAKALLSKVNQIDRILDEYKVETRALLERRDEEHKKGEREAARLRAVEIEELHRAIGEIKKELPRIGRLEEEMPTRRAEEKRLGDQVKQVILQAELALKQLEEHTRGIPYLEEGRRQDNRRIGQLEGETVEHSKRLETLAGKLQLLEDALGKIPPKFDSLYELLSARDKTIEEIRVMEFRRQQQMSAWEEELTRFRAQMTDYGDVVAHLHEQAQVNLKAASDLAAFQERLRQRAAEIAEVERIFENRIKRMMEEAQVGDEKRWQKYTTRIDERWHDHDRLNAEEVSRVDRLEAARDSIMAAIDELQRKHQELVHHLVDFGTGLAETRKSTLPNVSVPPATSPEDGLGIPDPRGRKRS